MAMGTIEYHAITGISGAAARGLVAQMWIGSMSRDEGLRLRRHRGEHAFLIETDAIATSAILGILKPRATDLRKRKLGGCPIDSVRVRSAKSSAYLSPPAVPAGNCRALAGGRSLVHQWLRRLRVHVRRALVGARRRRQTIKIMGTLGLRVH